MDPVLSDRSKYRNFYRTVPSDNDFNPARLALLHTFNWTRVATIFQGVSKGSARYGHVSNWFTCLFSSSEVKLKNKIEALQCWKTVPCFPGINRFVSMFLSLKQNCNAISPTQCVLFLLPPTFRPFVACCLETILVLLSR